MIYQIKKPGIIHFEYGSNKKLAKQLGLSAEHFCTILNGKSKTRYATAYLIVKLFDPEKEVLDFFDRIN